MFQRSIALNLKNAGNGNTSKTGSVNIQIRL
nr:hypothetical protein [Mucilaginibacter sp. SP1R1]